MNPTHILVRYGELFLKGKNQMFFEKKLVDNVKKILKVKDIKRLRGRSILPYFKDHKQLKRIFGIVSYSTAVRVGKNVEQIKKASLEILKGKKTSFKIVTKRSDKTFKIKSPELNVTVGKYVEEHTKNTFKFKAPKVILNIEINQDGAYIFTDVIKCLGGLPVGTGGNVITLIENKADILAALLMMKRGVNIFPVASKKYDISLLQQFSPIKLTLKILKNQKEIEKYAKEMNVSVIVVGEMFENYKKKKTTLTVLRPLIGLSREDIKTKMSNLAL